MLKRLLPGLALAVLLAVVAQPLIGQSTPTPAAPPAGPFDTLHFRPIGPASMSGRISDLAVYEADPSLFYVGTAHGGVWKTTNAGTTFEAQFQTQGLMSIGDVTISQSNPDLVWVGTGESNNRQSTSWGDGAYKSTDGGRTYVNMGLRTSRHINRIVIDPRDNNIVFVAATGTLWGPGGERGVYKTTDGGKTWKQVLKGDEDTGANELVMDPLNSRVLYASLYQRRRTACCMNGGGPGSGLYKSTDGGETWAKLKGGLPEGPLGRIGVDVYRRKPNTVYALIEAPTPPSQSGRGGTASPAAGQAAQGGQAGGGVPAAGGATGLYRSDDAGSTWKKVNSANPRPMYFSKFRIDPNDPEVVYLGGVGLWQTLDGGKNFANDVAASTHDDVHAIWINPANSRHVWIGNDGGLAVSYDMAKTWVFIPNLPVGLFYHVSVDMAVPYNVCGGMQDNYNWCGPSAVRGAPGIANHHWATLQGGDGFVVLQDPTNYRVAYTESQDGNMVRVDRVTFETQSIRPQAKPGEPALRWNWDTPLVMSPHSPAVIYAAANKVFRSSDRGLSWTAVSPDLTSNVKRDDQVTMGVKNTDITIARNDGIVAWPTIVSFAESPKAPGVLWAGTDDGRVAVTRDGGKAWTQVADRIPGLPKDIYVSEVVPSRFDAGTVYATFDGHRQNDFETWIYVSNDFGQNWRSVAGTLKGEVARTLTEDQKNPDVLYLGTETGLFVSLDRGGSWTRVKANLPTVRIDEITLHPRDNAMVLATHGRALWILDHLEPIQEYAAAQKADATLFTPPAAMYRRPSRDRNYEFWGDQVFYGQNPPAAARLTWTQKRQVEDVALKITDTAGKTVREITGQVLNNSKKTGMQTACWDLRVEPGPSPAATGGRGGQQGGQGQGGPSGPGGPGGQQAVSPFGAGCPSTTGGFGGGGFGGGAAAGPFVLPGTYTVALVVDGKTVDTKPIRVSADPEVALTAIERKKLFDMAMEIQALQASAASAVSAFSAFNTRLAEITKELAGRKDVPADTKTAFDVYTKQVAVVAPKFTAPAFGRGGQGGGFGQQGPSDYVVTKLTQAKNGLMGGMWPTEAVFDSYRNAKKDVPAAIAELNGVFAKGAAVAKALDACKVSFKIPEQIK